MGWGTLAGESQFCTTAGLGGESWGAMAKLQLWFGCGEGGQAGQGDSSDAQQMRMQSSLGLLHVAAA